MKQTCFLAPSRLFHRVALFRLLTIGPQNVKFCSRFLPRQFCRPNLGSTGARFSPLGGISREPPASHCQTVGATLAKPSSQA